MIDKQTVIVALTTIASVLGGDAIDINKTVRMQEAQQVLQEHTNLLNKMLSNQQIMIARGCQKAMREELDRVDLIDETVVK